MFLHPSYDSERPRPMSTDSTAHLNAAPVRDRVVTELAESQSVKSSPAITSPLRLIRKSDVLEKLQISKSTLHAKLDPRSPYYDPSFPRPIYLNGSRMPLWSEQAVDEWLNELFDGQHGRSR